MKRPDIERGEERETNRQRQRHSETPPNKNTQHSAKQKKNVLFIVLILVCPYTDTNID